MSGWYVLNCCRVTNRCQALVGGLILAWATYRKPVSFWKGICIEDWLSCLFVSMFWVLTKAIKSNEEMHSIVAKHGNSDGCATGKLGKVKHFQGKIGLS